MGLETVFGVLFTSGCTLEGRRFLLGRASGRESLEGTEAKTGEDDFWRDERFLGGENNCFNPDERLTERERGALDAGFLGLEAVCGFF